MQEKRKMKQIEVKDKNGYLEYTIIPNYKPKEKFLSNNEITLYKTLKKICYELKLTIFAQVSLSQILEINNRRKQQQLFNRIMCKSIDFVLYDEETNTIACCIELDDKTHEQEERKERDLFLDKIFNHNIKLIHIKSQKFYDAEEIKNKILEE